MSGVLNASLVDPSMRSTNLFGKYRLFIPLPKLRVSVVFLTFHSSYRTQGCCYFMWRGSLTVQNEIWQRLFWLIRVSNPPLKPWGIELNVSVLDSKSSLGKGGEQVVLSLEFEGTLSSVLAQLYESLYLYWKTKSNLQVESSNLWMCRLWLYSPLPLPQTFPGPEELLPRAMCEPKSTQDQWVALRNGKWMD